MPEIINRNGRAIGLAVTVLVSAAGNSLAQTRHDCGGPDRAQWIAACSIVIDNPREHPKARVKALKFRGAALHFQGDFKAAIADFSAVLAIDPNDFEALSDRGLAYQASGDATRALADDDKAIAINPKFAFAYFNRGIVEDSKGDVAKARQDYDEAIRLKPEYPAFYKNRGLLRQRQGDIAGAIADASTAIGINDTDPDVYINRGNAYRRLNALDKALADYESAMKLRPKSPAPYIGRGNLRGMEGNYDAAIADFDTAIKLNPKDIDAYLNRVLRRRKRATSPVRLRLTTPSFACGLTMCRSMPTAALRALQPGISPAPRRISSEQLRGSQPTPMCRSGATWPAPASARKTLLSSNGASNPSIRLRGRRRCWGCFSGATNQRPFLPPRPKATLPGVPTVIARPPSISASLLRSRAAATTR